MFKAFLTPQFLRFLLSGGVAATANFTARMIYEYWMGMSYSSAIIMAYITGMLVAFTLFRSIVFGAGEHTVDKEIAFFVAVNIAAIAQTWTVSIVLADYILPFAGIDSFRKELAHAAGVIVPTLTSFLGHKYLTFRKQADRQPD